jgi:branched-chain amino acid transport system ATP-binding protein
VLKNLTFSVRDKETFAVIGPNGAGKSTLFKALTGEKLPDSGSVHYNSRDVSRMPDYERVRLGFGRTFQVARIFPGHKVLENLIVAIEARERNSGARPGGLFGWRPAHEIVAEAERLAQAIGLKSKKTLLAGFLSHGDKKRLEIGVTLALRPKILMMDEPMAGMSPNDRAQTVELIKRVRERNGVTVLLCEHDMDVVFGLADRVMVLNYGEIIAIGSGPEVRENPAVRAVYLGEGAHRG